MLKKAFIKKNKTPILLQSELADCGYACISMIMSYHGKHMSLKEIRNASYKSARGLSILKLREVAWAFEFQTRILSCDINTLLNLKEPCILHWNFEHYVVLVGATKKKLIINDPSIGQIKIPLNEAKKYFTGIMLELSPKFKPQKKVKGAPLLLGKLLYSQAMKGGELV